MAGSSSFTATATARASASRQRLFGWMLRRLPSTSAARLRPYAASRRRRAASSGRYEVEGRCPSPPLKRDPSIPRLRQLASRPVRGAQDVRTCPCAYRVDRGRNGLVQPRRCASADDPGAGRPCPKPLRPGPTDRSQSGGFAWASDGRCRFRRWPLTLRSGRG